MPFNGSGTFTRLYSWVDDRNNSIKIQASRQDGEDDGFAAGLSQCITKDGQTSITANIPWGGYKLTNLGDATADTDALNRQSADARYLRQSTAVADLQALLDEAVHTATTVASASTCDILGAATDRVIITGTTTISSLGTGTHRLRFVHFTGALTLTHNATSLILPGGTNITTADGDCMIVASDGSSNARVLVYQKANGYAVAHPTASDTIPGIVELATTAEAETGTDTARAVTPAGLLAAISGVQTIFVPATAMVARTTNGADAGTTELTTNKIMIKSLDFDAVTEQYAQFMVRMPKSWNESTVTFQAVWSHTATTTNFGVVWSLSAVAVSDDDGLDASFGTAQTSTDTGGTTNDVYVSPASSAITIAGSPAEQDYVVFQISRAVANGSDTMAVDARLHGVTLNFTTNAMTDD